MRIDIDLISHLEKLARLRLEAAERDRLRGDLEKMLAMVEKLRELDLENVPPLLHLREADAELRPDRVEGQADRAAALDRAPDTDGQFFRVPKVIQP